MRNGKVVGICSRRFQLDLPSGIRGCCFIDDIDQMLDVAFERRTLTGGEKQLREEADPAIDTVHRRELPAARGISSRYGGGTAGNSHGAMAWSVRTRLSEQASEAQREVAHSHRVSFEFARYLAWMPAGSGSDGSTFYASEYSKNASVLRLTGGARPSGRAFGTNRSRSWDASAGGPFAAPCVAPMFSTGRVNGTLRDLEFRDFGAFHTILAESESA